MTGWLLAAAALLSVLILAARVGAAEAHIVEHIDRQVNHLGELMSDIQSSVDAVVAQLVKARTEIVAARDALVAQIADVQEQLDSAERPEDVDLSALTAAAQSLDDIVPDAPTEPVAEELAAEPVADVPADDAPEA